MSAADDMDCQDFVELVTEYLEDRLDELTRRRFDDHLATCPYCELYLEQIRDTRIALGRVELETISLEARDQLVAAFRTWRGSRPSS